MTANALLDPYGRLIEPATLKIERLLPGPIERVWAYLTESDLRRQWLASGEMPLQDDAPFELTWRNDELTDPPGRRPEGMGEEHSMQCRVIECAPPRRLVFTFGETGRVAIALEPQGSEVLLTLIHSRLHERGALLSVGAGWHAHLDLLVARMRDSEAEPHWDLWVRLRAEYDRRLPA